jgi:hypothetical protein
MTNLAGRPARLTVKWPRAPARRELTMQAVTASELNRLPSMKIHTLNGIRHYIISKECAGPGNNIASEDGSYQYGKLLDIHSHVISNSTCMKVSAVQRKMLQ